MLEKRLDGIEQGLGFPIGIYLYEALGYEVPDRTTWHGIWFRRSDDLQQLVYQLLLHIL